MQINKYVIRKQFLDVKKYKEIVENVFSYENLFKTWLGQISEFYRGSANPISVAPSISTQQQTRRLQKLIYPLINTLYKISSQHLNYVTDIMRQSASVSLYRDSQKIIEKINNLNHNEEMIELTFRDLLTSQSRIVTSPSQNIQFFYYSNWFKRINALEKYNKACKKISQSKPELQKVYNLSLQVEEQLLDFRKKIMNYKYGYLKQGVKMSRKLLTCLSQYLSIGKQILNTIMVNLKTELSPSQNGSRIVFRSSYSYNEPNMMEQAQMNYIQKAEQYKNTLSNIQNFFYFTKEKIDIKSLQENFKEMYSGNQNLINEMLEVFHLFQALASKRILMYEKISLIIQKIQNQNKHKKRAAEVMNTIMKRKSLDEQSLSTNSEERITKQFGLNGIQKSLTETIQYAIKTFNELSNMCYAISMKTTQPKQNANNMSISYEYKEIKIKSKMPNKSEIWLWKDWRDFRVFSPLKPKFAEKFITQELAENKKYMESQQSEEKLSCQIEGRHGGAATLQICHQKLQIKSKKHVQIHLILPYKDIDEFESNKKKLILKMNGGAQIKLSGFKNVNQTQKKISSHILKKQISTPKGSAPKKIAIALTPEQIQYLPKRAAQMQEKRIKLDKYTKFAQTTVQGATIQEVYEVLFSQKRSCPINKNMSFSQHQQAKNKNYDVKVGKYDKEGPYFYTGTNKQITFANCPLISIRQIQMEHPLPKIPFLPKSCHCKSKQQIYWVSNKQLDYCADVVSTGTDLMQSFFTTSLYKVKQTDDSTTIQIWTKVEFVKQTSMKGILTKGVQGQMKAIIPDLIKDLQKCLRLIIKQRESSGNPEDEPKQIQQQINKQQKQNKKPTQKTQLTLNKQLLVLAISTIILNILINVIF